MIAILVTCDGKEVSKPGQYELSGNQFVKILCFCLTRFKMGIPPVGDALVSPCPKCSRKWLVKRMANASGA